MRNKGFFYTTYYILWKKSLISKRILLGGDRNGIKILKFKFQAFLW
jgi:hypothetical protein